MRRNRKLYRRLTFLSVLVYSATALHAQQPYQVAAEAGIGFTGGRINDTLLSSSAANGKGIHAHAAFMKTGTKRKTVLEGSYSTVTYNADHDIQQHSFSLRLSDGYNILSKKNKYFSLYEGYMITTQGAYSPGNAAQQYSWSSLNAIGWYQSLQYVSGKDRLSFDIRVPLAGVVYRPPAVAVSGSKDFDRGLNSMYSNPAFASLHNNQAVDISLQYTRMISSHVGLSVQYNFNYQKWKGENPLTRSGQTFGLAATYRFH